MEIISKARWAADQPPPSGTEKLAMVGAWCEVLQDVPASELDECYLKASQAKRNGFAVNALEIIAAWNLMKMVRMMEGLFEPITK